MAAQETINECVQLLKDHFNNEVTFDTPVIVKKTPHLELFRCYGASTKADRLALLNPAGEWFEVKEDQFNVDYVVNSLLQRLKTMIYVGA